MKGNKYSEAFIMFKMEPVPIDVINVHKLSYYSKEILQKG